MIRIRTEIKFNLQGNKNSLFQPINDICCGEKDTEKHCKFQKDKVCLETDWDGDKNVYCYKDYTCQINSASYVSKFYQFLFGDLQTAVDVK